MTVSAPHLTLTLVTIAVLLLPPDSQPSTMQRVAGTQDLQGALDRARPGDVILLEAGRRYIGNFVLPALPDNPQSFITVRTDGAGLPQADTRTSPAFSGRLAVLQSPNNMPALSAAPGAHHWRLENLELAANRNGDGAIIELGASSTTARSAFPHSLVLDRLYIHGDPLHGQRRAIALNSGATTIVNSYIADIKGVGVDTQAIVGWAGPGPYAIENNYLEAAGENVMFGGGDPAIAALVPQHIVIRRNHITRPVSWRGPIVPAPSGVKAITTADAASLTPGTYDYVVVAERRVAVGADARSAASDPARVQMEQARSIRVEWSPVPGAAGYRVYRTGPGGTQWWRVTEPRFTDTGQQGTAGNPDKPTVWTVKNLLELKNAVDVTIDGNLLENHWAGAQSGYAVLFTPRNQEGTAPWSRVENVSFTNNVVRHVSAGINISGTDDLHPSGRARQISIRNNLFDDIGGATWGRPGDFVQIGNAPVDITIEHNTSVHTGRILALYGSKHGREVMRLVFRKNIVSHNEYGVIGDGTGVGTSSLDTYAPGAVFEDNLIAGGEGSAYPPRNRFVAGADFDAQFVSPARGDYRLKRSRGPDDPGVDMDALNAAIAGTTRQADSERPPRNTK
jgi:hypothetical protein